MLSGATTHIETMCPYVACLRSNQNNGGSRPVNHPLVKHSKHRDCTVATYLYVAISKKRFKSAGHFWMSSSSKNSHRVLLSLGLAPAISPAALPKIQRIIKGVYNTRFFLNNTFSIGTVFKALPHDSAQQVCNKPRMVSLGHLPEENNNKAAVTEIFTAAGITTSRYEIKMGHGVGQTRCQVNGINPLRSMAAWNYGVKLYHALIGDNEENSDTATAATAGAKRKPDDDDDKPEKKGTMESFFAKGKDKSRA